MLGKKTKGKAGFKVAKAAAKRPQQIVRASRILGETLAVTAPRAAYELGLAEPSKPKRTGPGVAAGIVIGAGAMYFLEPEHGSEHREKVAQLVS
ncbi:MAG TPA: hypothetical protein VFN87_02300 [Solirubrobacteraceae bacterium]|nr:hypothetical protein [Solirubrobacteraceae bacterium]